MGSFKLPGEVRSKKECKRGYRYFKNEVSPKYRSFWMEGGWLYGYTLKGVKHKMYPEADVRYRQLNFHGGVARAAREALKEKPKRNVAIRVDTPRRPAATRPGRATSSQGLAKQLFGI